jgi:hypothetical protein
MVLGGVSELSRTLHDVLTILQVQVLIEWTGRLEIDQLEFELKIIYAVA